MEPYIDLARNRFLQDNYARLLGIVLDELTETTIRMHMQLKEDMLNWFKLPHGAAIYSLADAAFSVLSNNSNNLSVALDCSIMYHASPAQRALLTVYGEAIANTEPTAVFQFKVYSEGDGARTLVATMKGIAYRTGKPVSSVVE